MNKKPGRPAKPKKIEELTLSSYREEITYYKQRLQDALEDEEYEGDKETITRFLNLPVSNQNIFIVYLIEDKGITNLATILDCDRKELFSIIMNTKKELKKK